MTLMKRNRKLIPGQFVVHIDFVEHCKKNPCNNEWKVSTGASGLHGDKCYAGIQGM